MTEQNHRPGSFRELFAVSIPLIISAGSHSLMNVADRIMLAGYTPQGDASSLDVIAAVTPSGMLYWTMTCLPLGTISYANTFISQYDGAKKSRELVVSFCQAVWLAIAAGLLMICMTPFSHLVFTAAGHSPQVIAQESAYFITLCFGSVTFLSANALSCYFSGRQKTSVVMFVNVVSVLINAVLDYGLIFGKWGLPEMGIVGAAVATVSARVFDIVVYALLIRREKSHVFHGLWKPDFEFLKKYLRFGVPSGLHYFLDTSGFLLFIFIVGSLSRDSMAATNLAFSVNGLIFIPLLGFGTAVQTLVGHHIGAKDIGSASRTTWNAILMALFWTGSTAILLVLFPELTLKPFLFFDATGQSEAGESVADILPAAASLLKFVAIYSVFDAMAVVFASALRGAGDTLFPMLVTLFSSWLVMTIPAWLISQMNNATIDQLWYTCTGHITLMGAAMMLRFLSAKWKTISVT